MGGVLETVNDASNAATAVDPFEHEQRFVLTRAQAAAFYAAVGTCATLELYDKARPISYTRTTYLDTDDFSYFRSCDGPVARRLRLREYAVASAFGETPVLSGLSFLELKQNAGTARSKVRLSGPPSLLWRLIDRGGRLDGLDRALAGLQPESALRLLQEELAAGRMAPRLSTWYRRTCLSGEGGRVRITLDENLVFMRPQPLGDAGQTATPVDAIAYGPSRVLEIKHWGDTPEWLARATEGLRPAPRFSKFRVGMMALAQQGAAPELPARSTTPGPALFLLSGGTAA